MAGEEIKFKNGRNFRQLGGYVTKDGRIVKYDRIYRGGNINVLFKDEEDISVLRDLHLKTILDFRSDTEAVKAPDPAIDGVQHYTISAMRHPDGTPMDFSPEGMQKMLENAQSLSKEYGRKVSMGEMFDIYYRRMPFDNPGFKKLFELLEKEEVPILFHCSAGKDRTGIAAILILLTLGVDKETALEDYLLTNDYRKEIIDRELERNADKIKKDPGFSEVIRSMNGVLRRMGEDAVDEIYREYGTFEAYLKDQFQIDEKRLERLRDMYLE